MKKYLLLCSTLLSGLVSSTNSYAMDLNEALTNAYNTNESLKASQQNFLNQAENFPQALAKFLPDISMSVNSQKQKSTSVSRYATGSQESGPDVTRSLNVTQNVFNGGQDAYGLKIAQSQFLEFKATLGSAEQKVLADSLGAYLGLCAAKEKHEIALAAVNFYSQSLEMAEEQLKVGEATITDVSAAQAKLYQAQYQKSQADANLLSAKANFKLTIGIDPTDDVVFPPAPDNMPENLDAFKAVVEKSNFDLMTVKSRLEQAKNGVKRSMGALLPNAQLSISESRNYYDPETPSSFGSQSNRQNSRSIQTQMSVRIPIYSGGGAVHSQIRQSKAQSRQFSYVLDYTRKQVATNVISTWENFSAMKDQLKSSEASIKAQTIALEGTKSGYSVGTNTMLDVLNQQDQLNQIKSQSVDIRTNYLTSAFQLKSLMGQMTAKSLKLKTKYFDPDYEFRNVKHKIVGF